MTKFSTALMLLSLFLVEIGTEAFQSFFKIPSLKPKPKSNEPELLKAISNTANGKDVTKTQQRQILDLVRELETNNPPDIDILTNPAKSKTLVDGDWYLQYTSPSEIEDDIDNEQDESKIWKPTVNEDPKIETKQFQAKGSVSAVGIKVDVSNRVPKQTFDLDNGLFFNEVELDFGSVKVGGPFKLSDKVPNRVIASFKEGSITFNVGFKIDLGLIFSLVNLARRTEEGGWLETTYISEDVRIGRGNKGSMFILTRNKDDVAP